MSATTLPYVYYILQKMRENVRMITPQETEWDTLELLDNNEVNIIAVGFPRYPNVLINKCDRLKKAGFNISTLTDSRLSPMVEVSNSCIFISVTTASLFDIYSTPIAFFNLLLRDAAQHMPDLAKRMDSIENLERNNKVYFEN